MATPSPTTRPTTTTFVSCVADREPAGQHRAAPAITEPVFSLRALWRAWRACQRGKRQARVAQRYHARLLDRLVETRDALVSHGWRPSRTHCFIVERPKRREIHAAEFGDRVVHHLLVERLQRLYEPVFIHDSYANRLGKGSHAAVDRLHGFMRSLSQGGQRPVYALQLDIANCFNRIHRPTLFRLIQGRLLRAVRRQGLPAAEAGEWQWLCRVILTQDAGAGARRLGPPGRHQAVPPHKRLGRQPPGYGLPIGNLTSQFFANVYLNELDQFVKHTLKAHHYLRYVDDFVLLHEDPDQLRAWRQAIEAFLADRLQLELKIRAEPVAITQGVDFLGYIVRPSHRQVRRRVVSHFEARLAAFARAHVRPGALRLEPSGRDRLRAQIASFLGHLRHARARRIWRRCLARYPWLQDLFDQPEQALAQPLRPAWEPKRVSGLAGQYRYFTRRHPHARVLLQAGNRWLLAAPGDPAARQRPGLGPCREFSAAELGPLCRRWRRQGMAHIRVDQAGHLQTGFRRRTLVRLWRPSPHSDSPPLKEY